MDPIGSKTAFLLSRFNSSILSAYYASGASLTRSVQVGALKAQGIGTTTGLSSAAMPPWQLVDDEAEAKLEQIFSSRPIIELPDDPGTDGNEHADRLFALWRGLARLREIAQYAETGKRADSMRSLLEQRFADSYRDVEDFAKSLEIPDITLIPGIAEASISSNPPQPKPLAKSVPEHIGAPLTTVRSDPIPGLTGTETFTIKVETSSGTTNVAIDLSAVSGTLDVDNVADYINTELQSAGATTRLAVERFSEFSYGFQLQMSSSETVTFVPDAATETPALYVAGSFSAVDGGAGFLSKLDDLGAAAPSDVFRSDIDTTQADDARAVATDSEGSVYVVGTTAGDLDDMVNQGTADLYLRKYDAAGTLLWSRLLGAASEAAGFAVAVDGSDNVVVAGQTRDVLTATAYGGNTDSFVTKFDSDGEELWTRQAAPYANDAAFALSTDASGNVFLAGYADSAVDSSVTHAGGGDAYVTKLDSDGATLYSKQFGGTGHDRAAAITVDDAGNFFVAGESDGRLVVRKYADDSASQTPIWEVDLGAVGTDGVLSGIALGDGGAVYVSGATDNAALAGTIVQAHSGGNDGFVSRIIDSGASAAADYTSYLGTTGEDRAHALTVKADAAGDEIYLAGATDGTLGGQPLVGTNDAYVAKLDATGATQWVHHIGGAFTHSGQAIAYDATGTSVVSRLGLPTSPQPIEPSVTASTLTSARAGQWFEVSVNGETFRRVTVEEGESFSYLSLKINQILGQSGVARYESDHDGMTLNIEARQGSRIELRAGDPGGDALIALGLKEAILFDEEGADEDVSFFALGLFDALDVSDRQAAADAGLIIDDAMRVVRKTYDRLIGVVEEDPFEILAAQQLSPEQSAKLREMRFALDRLTQAAATSPSLFDLAI